MKYGMNLLLWTGELNEESIPVLESLKEMGFDGVEVPIFNTDLDYAAWGQRLDDLGLERTAVTVRNEEDNPISSDAAVRAAGVEGRRTISPRRRVERWRLLAAVGQGELLSRPHRSFQEGMGP